MTTSLPQASRPGREGRANSSILGRVRRSSLMIEASSARQNLHLLRLIAGQQTKSGYPT